MCYTYYGDTMNKVVIIGCGNVGMSYAYSLLNQDNAVDELVLIDLDMNRVEGEVMDLNHCLPFAPNKMKISAGSYSDCKDASIVAISAGANQAPGETRMDLISKNSKIFKSIVSEVMKSGFDGIFLVATNPLDVMTHLTYKYSGLSSNRVIGTGTTLDSARLRYLIGEKLHISNKCIHGYVIGEHGDSEFVPWSTLNIGPQNISKYLTKQEMLEIEEKVRTAAYEIINKKGFTNFGIGVSMVRITNAILNDEHGILAVSTYDKKHDVYISYPAIIGRNGVEDNIAINLTQRETAKFNASIKVIKNAIKSIKE